jgi:signal transduction histidine kinase
VVDAEMAAIRNAFLLALAPALLLMAFGAWFISTRALRPVDQLSDTIRQVTAAGLGQRIEIRTADREFVQLINVFNAMLERLEASFGQASRFSADAAHELKTPLAILQGQIERSLAEAEAGSPLQVRLTVILDEVRRLSMISQKLLMLAQADAGRLPLQLETLDVSAMLEELVDDARMLAPQLRITGDIPPGLIASADAGLVQQILHNLISNAIKYNVDGGWVRIAASMTAREVLVSVSNPSHSIAAGEGSLIFQRFYRADRARARDIDGFGLGLNLSREIARAHGGDLTFEVAADQRVLLLLSLPRGETPQRHRSGS